MRCRTLFSALLRPRSLRRPLSSRPLVIHRGSCALVAGLLSLGLLTACSGEGPEPAVAGIPTPKPLVTPSSSPTPTPEADSSPTPTGAPVELGSPETESALRAYEAFELALFDITDSGASPASVEFVTAMVEPGGPAADYLAGLEDSAHANGPEAVTGRPYLVEYGVHRALTDYVELDVCWDNSQTALERTETPDVVRALPIMVANGDSWRVYDYALGDAAACEE